MIMQKLQSACSGLPNRSRGLPTPALRNPRTTITVKGERASLCATSQKYNLDRVQDDQQIQPCRCILDVIEVIPKVFLGVLDRAAIPIEDLSPPGNSWTNRVPKVVVRNLLTERCDKLGPLRTRPDKAHVAPQHVQQLWKLIHARLAKESAYTRDSRIVVRGPGWPSIRLGVGVHRAKFVAAKVHTVAPHAALPI